MAYLPTICCYKECSDSASRWGDGLAPGNGVRSDEFVAGCGFNVHFDFMLLSTGELAAVVLVADRCAEGRYNMMVIARLLIASVSAAPIYGSADKQ